ncbi:MAG: YncE family protein, partial [Pseudomonadota bacterium]
NDGSYNSGTVTGDATFNDSSWNGGTITGNATFNDSSQTWGEIYGNATFNDSSTSAGYIGGTATFNNSSQDYRGCGDSYADNYNPGAWYYEDRLCTYGAFDCGVLGENDGNNYCTCLAEHSSSSDRKVACTCDTGYPQNGNSCGASENQTCNATTTLCASGLTCAGDNKCHAPETVGANGEACTNPNNSECNVGSYCGGTNLCQTCDFGPTTLDVGGYANFAAFSPDGSKAYVVGYQTNNISVIDTATNTVSATVSAGDLTSAISEIAITADGSKAYVTNPVDGPSTVTVFNTATNSVSASILVGDYYPGPIVLNSNGTKAYVANPWNYNGTVKVIDTVTNTVSATISASTYQANKIGITPDGSKVYVANSNGTVSFINTANNTSTVVNVGGGGYYKWVSIGITPDSSKAYLLNSLATLSVIDLSNYSVITTISLASGINAYNPLAITSDGSKVFAAVNNTVKVINTATNAVSATVSISDNPRVILITPNSTPGGSKVFVGGWGGVISVIDPTTNGLLGNIGGLNPDRMASSPDGSRIYAGDRYNFQIIEMAKLTNLFSGVSPVCEGNRESFCSTDANCATGYGCNAGACVALTECGNGAYLPGCTFTGFSSLNNTYYIAGTAHPGLNSSGTGYSTTNNTYYIAGTAHPGLNSSGTGYSTTNNTYYVTGTAHPGLNSSGTGTSSTNGKYYYQGAIANGTINGINYTDGFTPTACSEDCYNGAQDLFIGSLRVGPSDVVIELVYANGSSGFKIWKEKDGTRILNATGLIANGWQKQLTRAGTGFSATDFTTGSNIAGRVCPTHVFLSHSNMTATGRCLYYDGGNAAQSLDAAGTSGTEASDWLQHWNRTNTGRGTSSSYYEGNIKTCADKGMRLPTMYETTMNNPGSYKPTGDGINPTFAGADGVPSSGSGLTSTASAFTIGTTYYWWWSGTNSNGRVYGLYLSVRCVLPSELDSSGTGYSTTNNTYYISGTAHPGLNSSGTGYSTTNNTYYVEGTGHPGLNSSGTGTSSTNGKYYSQ